MSEEFKRMTEDEYQALIRKVDRQWLIRCQLAGLAGFKCNYKNPRALFETEFDLTIRELYLEVLFRQPANAEQALKIVQDFYK